MRATEPTHTLTLPERVASIIARLRQAYGHHTPDFSTHPTDSLIATILSQHTSDINSGRAFAALKIAYPTWDAVAEADPTTLTAVIRSAGLGRIKAERIQAALAEIERRFGTMDLDFLRDLPLVEARAALKGVPGVGPKTAACVLMFACGHPALPVDTHVHRVAVRLGLIGGKISADRAHDLLEAMVPAEDVYDFHVNLISHGRQVCVARRPRCEACPLQDCCQYFAEHVAPYGAVPQ
jgi:endonuclease III